MTLDKQTLLEAARKYRKKPVVIEAVQWFKDGDHPKVVMRDNVGGAQPMVWSLEGWHVIAPGYWIIKGVKGEYYGVRPDIFAATYEPAQQSESRDAVLDGAWDDDAIGEMAGAALQSFPKIGYMDSATKIVRAVLKAQSALKNAGGQNDSATYERPVSAKSVPPALDAAELPQASPRKDGDCAPSPAAAAPSAASPNGSDARDAARYTRLVGLLFHYSLHFRGAGNKIQLCNNSFVLGEGDGADAAIDSASHSERKQP